MEADRRPLLPKQPQHQRWHQSSSYISVLYPNRACRPNSTGPWPWCSASYRSCPFTQMTDHYWACYGKTNFMLLPFGLRSAPKLFNALADALEWIAKWLDIEFLWHYLDDFISTGRPGLGGVRLLSSPPYQSLCSHRPSPSCREGGGAQHLPTTPRHQYRQLLKSSGYQQRSLQHAASIVRPSCSFIRHLYILRPTTSPCPFVSRDKI